MALALLLPILVVALVVLAVPKARAQGEDTLSDAHALRRIFQYLLLYGLPVVVATGVAGLVGRLLEGAILARSDQVDLARSLAFAVVGVPLFTGVALYSRRKLADNPGEARSLGWACYVTAASLTSLIMTMTAVVQVLRWATGLEEYSGRALAQALVWGGLWTAHWWIDGRMTPPEHESRSPPRRSRRNSSSPTSPPRSSLLGSESAALVVDGPDPGPTNTRFPWGMT